MNLDNNCTQVSCHTLVAGGGVAGVAAAVASARKGMKTVLIEKENFLGGVAHRAMLNSICGLYLNGPDFPQATLNDGICAEVATALMGMSASSKIVKVGKVYLLTYPRGNLERVLEDLCAREPNLQVMRDALADSVRFRDGNINHVEAISSSQGPIRIAPKAVVDCTGTGNMAYLAGAALYLPDQSRQLAAYTVRLRGAVDPAEPLGVKVAYHLARGAVDRRFPNAFRFTHFTPGDPDEESLLKFSVDTTEANYQSGKIAEFVEEAIHYLSDKIPSFASLEVSAISDGVVEREEGAIVGEYTLTEDDILSARKFHDGVAKNSWPMEIWDRHNGPTYDYLPDGACYEIPARCLKALGMNNLFCGGRIVSATGRAFASTRVMGACLATGEQAGILAASCGTG